ncbi:UNVERIFIED_CONTAM: RNA-binding protein pno1 [Sesamum radiatum]|uniref:RNA-binding protein pno1 n=1 Tax=Sesamum radiatum TaxID=300843 RepID=A0AAW2J012_SESRA
MLMKLCNPWMKVFSVRRKGFQFDSLENEKARKHAKLQLYRLLLRRCQYGGGCSRFSTATARSKTEFSAPKTEQNPRWADTISQNPCPQTPPHSLEEVLAQDCTAIYDEMKIDICMKVKARIVMLKTLSDTPDISNLQKCADFLHAFMLGFDFTDAVALLRLEELYVESFEIKDV